MQQRSKEVLFPYPTDGSMKRVERGLESAINREKGERVRFACGV